MVSGNTCPSSSTTSMGTSAFGAGLANSAVDHRQPLLPRGVWRPHPRPRLLHVQGAEARHPGRRPRFRASPARCSRPTTRCRTRIVAPTAREEPVGQRREHDGQPGEARNTVRRSHQPARPARGQDLQEGHGHARPSASTSTTSFNSGAVLTYNNTFVPGGPWLQPLTMLTPAVPQAHRGDRLLRRHGHACVRVYPFVRRLTLVAVVAALCFASEATAAQKSVLVLYATRA